MFLETSAIDPLYGNKASKSYLLRKFCVGKMLCTPGTTDNSRSRRIL